MINGIPATTQHNNHYMIMTERTHVSRHPCFGDDDGDNYTFDMQNTHGQLRFTLTATLPVTRNFSHYPTRTLLEVKKPYSSVSGCQACNHGIVLAVRTKLRVQSGGTGVRPFGGQIGPVVTCSLQSQLTWLLPAASPACQLPVDSIFSEPLGRLLKWSLHTRRPQRCPSVILTGGWHLLISLSWMLGLFDTCVWII